MRKRNFIYYIDTLFWYIVYMLPIFVLLLSVYRTGNVIAISDVFTDMNLNFVVDNVVVKTMSDMFGTGGVFPIFQNSDILIFLSYFVNVMLLHIVVDIILFIPRLAHKWMDKFCKRELD